MAGASLLPIDGDRKAIATTQRLLQRDGYAVHTAGSGEEALRLALEEKEHLMDELNHRVKNNLSMVASLVALKDRDVGEAADLTDVRNRIAAILAVHEHLQHTRDITHIPVRTTYVSSSKACSRRRAPGRSPSTWTSRIFVFPLARPVVSGSL